MNKKRLLAFLLAFTMVMPTIGVSAEEPAATPTEISVVEDTAEEPVIEEIEMEEPIEEKPVVEEIDTTLKRALRTAPLKSAS